MIDAWYTAFNVKKGDWYTAFNVKKGDKMFVPKNKRAHIW